MWASSGALSPEDMLGQELGHWRWHARPAEQCPGPYLMVADPCGLPAMPRGSLSFVMIPEYALAGLVISWLGFGSLCWDPGGWILWRQMAGITSLV